MVIIIENNPNLFRGQPKLNFRAYFYEDGTYVEEFDTPDGQHWRASVRPEEYTPAILARKIEWDLEGIPYK